MGRGWGAVSVVVAVHGGKGARDHVVIGGNGGWGGLEVITHLCTFFCLGFECVILLTCYVIPSPVLTSTFMLTFCQRR